MKDLKSQILKLGISMSFAIALAPAFAKAQSTCGGVHQEKFTISNVAGQSSSKVRETVLDFLRENRDVPAFIRKSSQGDVPVIMLNAQTLPKLRPLLAQSAGYMFVQQVGYRNDHGLMRTGSYIIDADTPGARGYGELHANGLAWKDVNGYLPRMTEHHSVMIETGYLLPREDFQIINYYQKVRRASIFRVPFTFGGNPNRNLPNMIDNIGEHCFVFCKGAIVRGSVANIAGRLQRLGATDVEAIMKDSVVSSFLAEVQQSIQIVSPDDGRVLNWGMYNGPAILQKLAHVIPQNLVENDKRVFVNWLIAMDASKKYSDFLTRYQVSSDGGYQDMNNGQTSFMLIYAHMNQAPAFRDATFQSPGVFYSWSNQNQRPL